MPRMFVNKKEDNYDDIGIYKGPLNLSSVTMKDPVQVFTNMFNLLKKAGVTCESNSRFKGVFSFKGLRC